MNYWFASIPSRKERFTSLTKAEDYKQKNGGSIKTVPVYETKKAVEDWIQQQENPSLYLPMYFSEPAELTSRKHYEPHSRSKRNIEMPSKVYFVVLN